MIRQRLLAGDMLRILFADGVGFDVWVEKYANPPQVFFEGKAFPLDRLEEIAKRCEEYLQDPGIKALWNGQLPTKPAGP